MRSPRLGSGSLHKPLSDTINPSPVAQHQRHPRRCRTTPTASGHRHRAECQSRNGGPLPRTQPVSSVEHDPKINEPRAKLGTPHQTSSKSIFWQAELEKQAGYGQNWPTPSLITIPPPKWERALEPATYLRADA